MPVNSKCSALENKVITAERSESKLSSQWEAAHGSLKVPKFANSVLRDNWRIDDRSVSAFFIKVGSERIQTKPRNYITVAYKTFHIWRTHKIAIYRQTEAKNAKNVSWQALFDNDLVELTIARFILTFVKKYKSWGEWKPGRRLESGLNLEAGVIWSPKWLALVSPVQWQAQGLDRWGWLGHVKKVELLSIRWSWSALIDT